MPEQVGRPAGSSELAVFRERVTASLAELGLSTQLQETEACPDGSADCVPVTNFFTVIEGQLPGSVVFMAHYDAVPGSPGAADNGISVAVLVELARNILSRDAPVRTTVLLFTDAEEVGHLGSTAFFSSGTVPEDLMGVFNFDGSGSSGPSRVLRTAPGSGRYLRAYAEEAEYPLANSIRHYLFDRLGSGTDFSEAMEAGLAGLDFTFVGSRWNWHEPTDRLEAVDPRTIQHHGENASALVRAVVMGGAGLEGADDYVYLTVSPGTVLLWPSAVGSWVLVVLSGLAILSAGGRHPLRNPRDFLVAAAVVAASMVVAALAARAGLALAGWFVDPRPQWPDSRLPWWAILFAVPFVAAWSVTFFSRSAPWDLMLCAAWAYLALAAASTGLDPRFGAPFVAAASGTALVLLAVRFIAPRWRWVGWSVAMFWVAFLFMPISHMAEVTYGFRRATEIFWPWALTLMAAVPLFASAGHSYSSASEVGRGTP